MFNVKKKTSKYVTLSNINKTTSCQGHIEYNTSVIICTAKKKKSEEDWGEWNWKEEVLDQIQYDLSQYPEPTNGTAIMNINYI